MKRRSKRIGAVLALGTILAVVIVLLLSDGSSSPTSGTTPSYTGSATVQRRNLVATDTESGTLSYANPQTVYNWQNGTITWLPQVGRLIKPGHVLFDVANQPVILMDGSEPAYRNLGPSDSAGPDILELNRNLVNLGYNPDGIVVDDEWQAATTAGVETLQAAEGWTVSGTLTLGQVAFLPGPQLVAAVDGTVGSTGGGTAAGYSDPPPHSLFVDDSTTSTDTTEGDTTTGTTTTSNTTGTTTGAATGTTTVTTGTTTTSTGDGTSDSSATAALDKQIAEIKAELRALRKQLREESKTTKPSPTHAKPSPSGTGSKGAASSGATGSADGASSAASGGGNGSAVEILQTNSTQLVVTVDLSASLQSEASIGERVTVEMPDGSLVAGKVTAVSSVASTSSSDAGSDGGGSSGGGGGGSGSSATIPVTITLAKRAKGAGLDQAAVSVAFTQAKASNVLSVPVTALIATSGRRFAVQQAVAPYKLIPVTTGLFAAGYVQISGSGIYQGLKVTDSQG